MMENNNLKSTPNPSIYPKVLIIHIACINNEDQVTLLLRSLFSKWPRQNLSQIFISGDNSTGKFCDKTYKLSADDRYFGKIYFALKKNVSNPSGLINLTEEKKETKVEKLSKFAQIKNRIIQFFYYSGIWEIIFAPKLSHILTEWIREIRPDVIYCQGFQLGFCWLPLMIQKRFSIPIVFHTSDDWPNNLYRNYPLMHLLVKQTAKKLIRASSRSIAFSPKMAESYKKQFNKDFDIVMNCDSYERISRAQPKRIADKDVVSIIYLGGLGQERWKSLVEFCKTVEEKLDKKFKVVITAFASNLPIEAIDELTSRNNLRIRPPLSHDEVPEVLKGGDILLLPETFDKKLATDIKFSISTKAHLYMMSEKPILVLGSPITGVVDYAKEEKWAVVVDRPDKELLAMAVEKLIEDKELRKQLIETGRKVSIRNHDIDKTSAHMLEIFSQVINGQ